MERDKGGESAQGVDGEGRAGARRPSSRREREACDRRRETEGAGEEWHRHIND